MPEPFPSALPWQIAKGWLKDDACAAFSGALDATTMRPSTSGHEVTDGDSGSKPNPYIASNSAPDQTQSDRW